ncbi:alpha/beta hydrolase [Acidobacteria bacterium AH-259-G07]|nr:alpha/beta hydrolase [Acidobacteria bacterium AH-259-G07]
MRQSPTKDGLLFGPAKDHWIEIDGVGIHYLAAGETGSCVVLLHGGSADSASLSWWSSIGPFSQAYRVFAPDLPGYGKSDKPNINYTTEYYTHFLERFVQNLGLNQFCLVGLSMGGQISLNFTLQFPQRVEKLVLVSSAGFGTRLRWQILAKLMVKMPWLHARVRKVASRSRETIKLILRYIVYNSEVITEDLAEEIFAAISTPGTGRAWRSYLENEMDWSGFRSNFLSRLGEITVPTLVVHGSDDKLVPVKWARTAQKLIPDSRLCILQQCGHWPQREKPVEFHRAALNFLKK